MSVSINGTGSITGLSVGGLPDGSVDADSIAASAVTDAKIGTGAVTNAKLGTGIDAAKLADGSVTSTELQYINSLSSNAQTQISGVGGGKILQVQSSFDGTGGQTTTRNTWAEIGTAVTLTPAATSSTILLFSKANGYIGGGSGYALLYYSIQRTLSGTATDDVSTKADLYLDARSAGTLFGQTSANIITLGKDSPSTTSQLTYQAQYYTNGINYSGTVGAYNIDLIAVEVGA